MKNIKRFFLFFTISVILLLTVIIFSYSEKSQNSFELIKKHIKRNKIDFFSKKKK
jgi:hypothetical protein